MYILLYAHFLWRQESSGSFTNSIFSPIVYLTVLDWVQYKYQRSFFLNYSIKCQHTHILACSSYDLISNMMLTLVCQSRPTGAAHLVRKKTQRGFIFLESYQKGAAKANSNEPYWSFFLHHFKQLLNEEKIPNMHTFLQRKADRGEEGE